MTETLNLPTATELAQTKSKQTQAMNNTIPNLTIIYYSETEEKTELTLTNTTPNLSSIY
jgi:hypothetical protein